MRPTTESFTDRVRRNVDALEEMLASGSVDLVRFVRSVEEIETAARQLLGPAIALLRSSGRTWQEIGRDLGISRQAAEQRFRPHLARELRDDARSDVGDDGDMANRPEVVKPTRLTTVRNGSSRRRQRLAERRLSARVADGFLRLEFLDGEEAHWPLPFQNDHEAIARLSLEAQGWAGSLGATHGQQKAVHKALTEAGYYNTGSRR